MSAGKVDVLAVMDRAASQHWAHQDNADAEDMEAARAVVAELIEADRWLDKCEAALETRRSAEEYTEAWAATQLEMHRTRDLGVKRRDAALARIGGEA